MLRTLAIYLLLTGMLLAGLPAQLWANSSEPVNEKRTQRELDEVKRRIQTLQKTIRSTQQQRSSTEVALKQTETDIGRLHTALREAARELQDSQQRIKALTEQQSSLQSARERQQAALVRDIQAAYRTGRQEYLKLLLNQQRPETLARTLKYYDYVHKARFGNITAFTNTLRDLEENRRRLDQEAARLTALQEKLRVQQQALEASQQQRRQVLATLTRELRNKDSQLNQLRKNESELHALLKAVQETLADLPQHLGSIPFQQTRGKLSLPTPGRIVHRFGSDREEGAMRWNGIVIRSKPGAPVKAVHRGRVVFSDWLRGFGLLTIIDHGNQYLTLYGHNESLLKEPGAWVDSHDIIAYTGSSGGQEDSGLYFELRHRGDPINPSSWFKR